MADRAKTRRVMGRLLTWLARLSLLALLVCGLGWRYGFTPLPAPAPGVEFQPVAEVTWDGVGAENCWYWFRELDRGFRDENRAVLAAGTAVPPDPAQGAGTWTQMAEAYARSAKSPAATSDRLDRWLADHPQVEHCFRAVLESSDNRSPKPASLTEVQRALLLSHYPLVQAARQEARGDGVAALHALVRAWTFQARLTPLAEFSGLFDERGVEQVNVLVARPWRRLALSLPTLPAADGKEILAELAKVPQAMTGLEEAYRRLATRSLADAHGRSAPGWSRVQLSFRGASLRLRQDFGRLFAAAIERVMGGRQASELNLQGVRHFGRPFAELLGALQQTAARREDFAALERAWLTRALAQLRQDRTVGPASPAAPSWPARNRWSWLRRQLDRPAVWNSVQGLPTANALRETTDTWLVYLESCRLTLALRLFRDQHGAWPDRLDQLVPDLLPAVPIDPFTGQPFGYERQNEGWQLWSVGPAGHRPTAAEATQPPQRLFRSREE